MAEPFSALKPTEERGHQPPGRVQQSTVDAWRFTSMMSTAMTMTAAVAHLMEMPAKMRYEPRLYVRLHRTLYPTFGRTAGPAEPLAVAATGTLAWLTRRRNPASFRLTAAAAGCLAAAHGIFWGVVQPANVVMSRWPLDAIPGDWRRWRDRWEYGHAVRAGLATAALGALTWSLLEQSSEPGTA
jgi:Domain of unknown function (DUF1772)